MQTCDQINSGGPKGEDHLTKNGVVGSRQFREAGQKDKVVTEISPRGSEILYGLVCGPGNAEDRIRKAYFNTYLIRNRQERRTWEKRLKAEDTVRGK
jgi:hypothetical protein